MSSARWELSRHSRVTRQEVRSPFTGTICASINEEIVHGIPGKRKLKEGDIFSVDVGAIVKGFHWRQRFHRRSGDISDEAQRLIDTTRESLRQGIAQAMAGARIGDIGHACRSMPSRTATP